jgi:hypothetical protein
MLPDKQSKAKQRNEGKRKRKRRSSSGQWNDRQKRIVSLIMIDIYLLCF